MYYGIEWTSINQIWFCIVDHAPTTQTVKGYKDENHQISCSTQLIKVFYWTSIIQWFYWNAFDINDVLYLLCDRHDELPVAARGIPAVLHSDVPLTVPVDGPVVIATVTGPVNIFRGKHGHSVNLINRIMIIYLQSWESVPVCMSGSYIFPEA